MELQQEYNKYLVFSALDALEMVSSCSNNNVYDDSSLLEIRELLIKNVKQVEVIVL